MNISEIKDNITLGKYDKDFSMLYGDVMPARLRYTEALDSFNSLYPGHKDVRIFSAPGRTEISGNHTDHQHGSVLAGSVNLDVIAIVGTNDGDFINIKSHGYDMDTIKVDELDKRKEEEGAAISLIRGVCSQFADKGCNLKGFDAYTTSNVLKGSGLSSSAAFEVLIGTIVNAMFNDNKTDSKDIAKIGQYAENVYFGKPSGLLDQMASSLGGFTFADFHNPSNPVTESISLDISSFGYSLCVVDTGGNHANLTQDYADITVECKNVSNYLGVEYLRDADEEVFYNSIGEIRAKYGDRCVLRAIHFFNEQKRVYLQKESLETGKFENFLEFVNESGQSSYDCLQNLYSTSSVSEQGLPLAITLTKQFLGEKGACRVHGGGFAGTIQCYIPTDAIGDYKKMIEKVFGKGSCCILSIRPVGGYEIM